MNNRILFGVMTLIFNCYGIPCFMQGRTKTGILRIVLGIVTFGILAFVNEIFGIIEGIKILRMTDEEFEACKYELGKGIPK